MMNKHLRRDALNTIENLGELNVSYSGKKILITGTAGFLGAHFIHYFLELNDSGLLRAPCQVYALDNFLRGTPSWIEKIMGRSDISILKKDIIRDTDYGHSDFIIHAASIASPIYYRKNPIETMDANVIGLRNLLEHAKNDAIESFLYFSTSEIYGDPDPAHIPTNEEYRGYVSCTGPRACYDESKRFGETLCVNFWRQHQIPVKIARPFNNYGPGLKITDRRVIPDFFRDVLSEKDITLLSDGKATRTFCYISDAIEGYLRILLSEYQGEAFNIGVEKPEISIRDLAAKIIEISGKSVQLTYQESNDPEYTTDNPQRRCPSIGKASQFIGYQPQITLDEGLERTHAFYLDHQSGSDN
jgi:nucleoside-diphosphate-sugar epimerase